MSQVVSASLSLNLTSSETLSLGLATSQAVPGSLLQALSWANGSGAGQVQEHWEAKGVTLAASGAVTYTLSALTDTLGRAVAFASVVALAIRVTSRTAGDYLTVGNAATHPWTAILGGTTPTFAVWDLELKAAGSSDGFAVTSGSSDQLLITNSGSHSITFDIAVIGR